VCCYYFSFFFKIALFFTLEVRTKDIKYIKHFFWTNFPLHTLVNSIGLTINKIDIQLNTYFLINFERFLSKKKSILNAGHCSMLKFFGYLSCVDYKQIQFISCFFWQILYMNSMLYHCRWLLLLLCFHMYSVGSFDGKSFLI